MYMYIINRRRNEVINMYLINGRRGTCTFT